MSLPKLRPEPGTTSLSPAGDTSSSANPFNTVRTPPPPTRRMLTFPLLRSVKKTTGGLPPAPTERTSPARFGSVNRSYVVPVPTIVRSTRTLRCSPNDGSRWTEMTEEPPGTQ